MAAMRADGAGVDDPATNAALDHLAGHVLGEDERRAVVDVDLIVPPLVGDVPAVFADAHSGVVDEDVELRHGGERFFCKAMHVRQARQIGRDGPRLDAVRRDLVRRPLGVARSRPWTTTFAPSCASRSATARPMPRVLPVTNAICPANRRSSAIDRSRASPFRRRVRGERSGGGSMLPAAPTSTTTPRPRRHASIGSV